MGSIYDWSLVAADNANADDSINWAEGQPPSSVNNSARAMMQRLREFVADLSGAAEAGGSLNTLTVKSKVPVRAYANGIIIRFRATGMNGAQTTLNLNNLGARPIMKAGLHKAVELEGGELQRESIYECIYNSSLGNNGAWFLTAPLFVMPKPAAPPVLPAGFVAPFCNTAAPEGWLKCNGQWVSRESYADLYKAIGDRFGFDSRSAAFRLPDLRGEFIRGWVDDRDLGLQKGRGFGTWENDRLKYHRHKGATDWGGNHSHEMPFGVGNADGGGWHRGVTEGWRQRTLDSGNHQHGFTTDFGFDEDGRMANETRPMNIALLYCIKC